MIKGIKWDRDGMSKQDQEKEVGLDHMWCVHLL